MTIVAIPHLHMLLAVVGVVLSGAVADVAAPRVCMHAVLELCSRECDATEKGARLGEWERRDADSGLIFTGLQARPCPLCRRPSGSLSHPCTDAITGYALVAFM